MRDREMVTRLVHTQEIASSNLAPATSEKITVGWQRVDECTRLESEQAWRYVSWVRIPDLPPNLFSILLF